MAKLGLWVSGPPPVIYDLECDSGTHSLKSTKPLSVCVRERESMCDCVCVRERERLKRCSIVDGFHFLRLFVAELLQIPKLGECSPVYLTFLEGVNILKDYLLKLHIPGVE